QTTDPQQPTQLKTLASIEHTGSVGGYSHLAYTFTPHGKTIISGGKNGFLAAYDLTGKLIGRFNGHESDMAAVAISNDGRFLISGSQDQTINLWNLKTRELLVTLFYGEDGDWVMWTPQGYYTGTPGADRMIGWQINKGADKVPEFIGAEQLRQHLNRPDIVERGIILGSAAQAVREAAGTAFKISDLLQRPVPRFRIVSPTPGSMVRGARTQVRISVSPTPDPIKFIRVQVNGRQVSEFVPEPTSTAALPIPAVRSIDTPTPPTTSYSLDVPLSNGSNEIRLSAVNAIGERTEVMTVRLDGEGALDKRGTLYILAIGVDKYPAAAGRLPDLRFSSAGAQAFVDAISQRIGAMHNNVVTTLLTNGPNAT